MNRTESRKKKEVVRINEVVKKVKCTNKNKSRLEDNTWVRDIGKMGVTCTHRPAPRFEDENEVRGGWGIQLFKKGFYTWLSSVSGYPGHTIIDWDLRRTEVQTCCRVSKRCIIVIWLIGVRSGARCWRVDTAFEKIGTLLGIAWSKSFLHDNRTTVSWERLVCWDWTSGARYILRKGSLEVKVFVQTVWQQKNACNRAMA